MENGELLSSCQHLDLCVNQLNSILKWWLLWSHAHVFNGIYHHAVEPTHWMKKKRAVTTTTLGLSWTGKRTLQPEDAKANPSTWRNSEQERPWRDRRVHLYLWRSISLSIYISLLRPLSENLFTISNLTSFSISSRQANFRSLILLKQQQDSTTTSKKQTTYQPTTKKKSISLFSVYQFRTTRPLN